MTFQKSSTDRHRDNSILGFAVRELIKEGVPEHAIAMHGTKVMVDEVARTFGAKSEIRSDFFY